MSVLQRSGKQMVSHLDRLPIATAVLCLTAAAVAVLPWLQSLLQFDVVAIRSGELWRFLTGHLTHWNVNHFLWDIAVFGVLGTMCERRDRALFLTTTLISAGAISIWMMWTPHGLQTYRGLSGIDTALFSLLATLLLGEARSNGDRATLWTVGVGAAGLALKTWWEFHTGATMFVDQTADFVAVPMAHVLGGLVGLLVALGSLAVQQTRWVSRLAVCDATDDLAW